MTKAILPKTNQTGTAEWEDVEANDRALRDVLNSEIDNENIKANAKIAAAKLSGVLASVTGSNLNVSAGEATVEWPGGSIDSKTVEVTHGLGAKPTVVLLTSIYSEATRRMIPHTVSTSTTKIVLNSACADAVPGAGVKQTIHWLAIG